MAGVKLPDRAVTRRFHRRLLAWYARHGRDLPWRRTREPYRVLVSEIMLQQTQVDRVIPKYHEFLARYPTGFGNWLQAAALAVDGIVELAIVGSPADAATQALLGAARDGEPPNLVVAVSAAPEASAVPLLADRTMIDGRPTAYVCRDFACRLPVTDPAAFDAFEDGLE